jgi:two-component system response regulator
VTTREHSGSRSDVLVVEDDEATVRLLREAYREVASGTTIHAVADGVAALDYLFRRGEYASMPRPQLVLLDLGLPLLDGKSVLRELRGDEALRSVPIVVFTDSTDGADARDAFDLGADAYVNKPTHFGEFLTIIEELDEWVNAARKPA